jgi:catechol-2,3-dioxygenase
MLVKWAAQAVQPTPGALMPALGIDHYNLHAERDLLDLLCAFYCEVVGLEPGPRPPLPTPGYWLYAKGRAIVHLSETMPGETRVTHTATTFDHLAFACAGAEQMQEFLVNRQIPFRRSHVPPDGPIQLFLSDPAGNGVELIFA